MKKRILSLLLAALLALTFLPASASAGVVTAYLSISEDGAYVNAGDASGTLMALVPVTVPYFDLALYGLEKYYFVSESYEGDGTGMPSAELGAADPAVYSGRVTLLHLYIYALEVYYLGISPAEAGKGRLKDYPGTDALTLTGEAGSSYMTSFWGHDENLIYYVNRQYPLASPGWGATSDQILLRNGDIVDVSMYTDWSFFSNPNAGYVYLSPAEGAASCSVAADGQLSLTVSRAWGGLSGDYTTASAAMPNYEVYYAPEAELEGGANGDVTSWIYLGATNAYGAIAFSPAALGLGEGAYRVACPGSSVSAPGCIYVNVTSAPVTPPQPADPVKPVITAQPVSCEYHQGAQAEALYVEAFVSDGALFYQWQTLQNGVWSDISGANEASYIPASVSAGSFSFRCVITNTLNGLSVVTESAEVKISVLAAAVHETPAAPVTISETPPETPPEAVTATVPETPPEAVTATVPETPPEQTAVPPEPETKTGESERSFSDVAESDWFYDDVRRAASLGLIEGKDGGLFEPMEELTLAQTLTLAVRLYEYMHGLEYTANEPGRDWYAPYAESALEYGLISPEAHDWNGAVTRGEMSLVFARLLTEYKVLNDDMNYFNDVPPSGSVRAAICALYSAGITQGKDAENRLFGADDTLKRCEAAAMLLRFVDENERITLF